MGSTTHCSWKVKQIIDSLSSTKTGGGETGKPFFSQNQPQDIFHSQPFSNLPPHADQEGHAVEASKVSGKLLEWKAEAENLPGKQVRPKTCIETGRPQGDNLSPIMFKLVMEQTSRHGIEECHFN